MRYRRAPEVASPPGICPRCLHETLRHLPRMCLHTSYDWFKCDGCDLIVTTKDVDDCLMTVHPVQPEVLRGRNVLTFGKHN